MPRVGWVALGGILAALIAAGGEARPPAAASLVGARVLLRAAPLPRHPGPPAPLPRRAGAAPRRRGVRGIPGTDRRRRHGRDSRPRGVVGHRDRLRRRATPARRR